MKTIFAFLALLLLSAPAFAASAVTVVDDEFVFGTAAVAAGAEVLTEEDMEDRGKGDPEANQNVGSEATDNTVNVTGNLTNGDVTISDLGSGITSAVINTGNNAALSSAVNIAINFEAAPTP